MAIQYGFYNSVDGDRKYDSSDFSRIFDGIITEGVLPTVGTAFELTANSTRVIVGTGRAWFQKTWTWNDSSLYMDLPAASSINPRIDSIMLEVNKNNRTNSLIWVQGTPSTSPVPPSTAADPGVFRYRFGNVYRSRDGSTITQSDITYTIGTSDTPVSANALPPESIYSPVDYKKSIVRGSYLGSAITAEQGSAIKDGSFDGLYLGDYWTYNNVNYRIVDFNYWLGKTTNANYSSRITKPHVVLMPDDLRPALSFAQPFQTNYPYDNSNNTIRYSPTIWKRGTPLITQFISFAISMYGAPVKELEFNNQYPTSYSAGRDAYSIEAEKTTMVVPNEYMIYGTRNLARRYVTHDMDQLALFKLSVRNIYMGHDRGEVAMIPSGRGPYYGSYWLTGNYTNEHWTCVHDTVGATADATNDAAIGATHSTRPIFAVSGD